MVFICPVCLSESLELIYEFDCIHCNLRYYIYECKKCGDRLVIPEEVVTMYWDEKGKRKIKVEETKCKSKHIADSWLV